MIEGRDAVEIPLRYIGKYEDFAGPGRDLHLVQLEGPIAEEVGVAAGMSGSPVFIDGQVIGALSHRLGRMPRRPVAGVTPLEDVLSTRRAAATGPASTERGLSPIATPVTFQGATPAVRHWLAERLAPLGFEAVAGGASEAGSDPPVVLGPGSPVGVQLLRGDMGIAATGTVTWVEHNRVYAFGHPFLGSGRVEMPLVAADVVHTLPDLAGSFKLTNVGAQLGAVVEDRLSAIVGETGAEVRMVPIALEVSGADYGSESFHFEMVRQAEIAPLLAAAALANALQLNNGFTRESTLAVRGTIGLGDLPDLPFETVAAGVEGSDPSFTLAAALFQELERLWNSPLAGIEVMRIDLRVSARAELVGYTLDSVQFDRRPLERGEPLHLRCTLRELRGVTVTRELSLELPELLREDESLTLVVGNPSLVDRAMGSPLARRVATAGDARSLVSTLSEPRSPHRLRAVVLRSNGSLVVRGQSYADLPPTARRLLASQQHTARPAPGSLASPLAAAEVELDGPLEGSVRLPLQLSRLAAGESGG